MLSDRSRNTALGSDPNAGMEIKKYANRLSDMTYDIYKTIARSEQIRNASDYDDFYVADKAETRQQVENARKLVEKI